MKILQNIDTDSEMKQNDDIWKKNYVAEIAISSDGKFLYCSNRGYDTIAVFKGIYCIYCIYHDIINIYLIKYI